MMGFKDVLRGILARRRGSEVQPPPPDDETRDKVLKALRRQRRVQLEEQEKVRLRKQITAYNRRRDGMVFSQRAPPLAGTGFEPKRLKGRARRRASKWF